MASYFEINSFVSKFCQLWCDGRQADLHLQCFNGQSYLNLNIGLGYAFQATAARKHDGYSHSYSTSRSRRTAKRAKMKEGDIGCEINKTSDDVSSKGIEDSISPTIIEDDVNIENATDLEDHSGDSNFQEGHSQSDDTKDSEHHETHSDNSIDNVSEDDGATPVEDTHIQLTEELMESKADTVKRNDEDTYHAEDEIGASKDSGSSNACEPPKYIEVHAMAIFENSPSYYLTQDELESLGRFVTNLEHLQRNIHNIVLDSHTTSRGNDGRYTHSADIRIFVKSEHLWESARKYLWKHLGQDIWERGNGTVISLKRIHQKD